MAAPLLIDHSPRKLFITVAVALTFAAGLVAPIVVPAHLAAKLVAA